MLLLAIDTSAKNGSLALALAHDPSGENIEVIETTSLSGGTFSAQLVPQIAALLSAHGFTRLDIGAFAVAAGPGSFTGLRIGLAAVKALAEVLQKPIAAVSLLELCAVTSGLQGKVMAVLDAGRGDVYTGEFNFPKEIHQPRRERMLSRTEFLSQSQGWSVVTPDVVLAEVAAAAALNVTKLPAISAADVARLGWQVLRSGNTVTPEQLDANYIRRTDAEMLAKIGS